MHRLSLPMLDGLQTWWATTQREDLARLGEPMGLFDPLAVPAFLRHKFVVSDGGAFSTTSLQLPMRLNPSCCVTSALPTLRITLRLVHRCPYRILASFRKICTAIDVNRMSIFDAARGGIKLTCAIPSIMPFLRNELFMVALCHSSSLLPTIVAL